MEDRYRISLDDRDRRIRTRGLLHGRKRSCEFDMLPSRDSLGYSLDDPAYERRALLNRDRILLDEANVRERMPLEQAMLRERDILDRAIRRERVPLGQPVLRERDILDRTMLRERDPLVRPLHIEEIAPIDRVMFRERDHLSHTLHREADELSLYRLSAAELRTVEKGLGRLPVNDEALLGRNRLDLEVGKHSLWQGPGPREFEIRDTLRRSDDFDNPENAYSTLYVQGLPLNCTFREVSHIFRPFVGFKELRLRRKDDNLLCFVEFDSPKNAAVALEALQGYKMDESDNDSATLRIEFSKVPKKKKTFPPYHEHSRLPWL